MQEKLKIKRTSLMKWFTIFIALYPILNVYSVLILPLGDLVALFFCAIFIIDNIQNTLVEINSIPHKKNYYYFLIYVFASLPIMLIFSERIDFEEIASKSIHLLLYFFMAFLLGVYYIKMDYLVELIKKFTTFFCYVIILQQLLSIFANVKTYLLLPILKLNYLYSDYSDYLQVYMATLKTQGYRPSAFFLEPAHACAYIIIGFVLLLFSSNKKTKDYIHILVCIIAIASSYSTGGIITAFAMICYYIFTTRGRRISRKETVFKFSLFIFLSIGIVALVSYETRVLSLIVSRIESIGTNLYNSTGNIRVLRGWYVWNELPIINRVFGTGIGNLLQEIENKGILVLSDAFYMDDMNLLFCSMCTFGIVGSFLYFYSFIRSMGKKWFKHALCYSYFVSCLYSNWIYHALSILIMIVIFYDYEIKSMPLKMLE